MSTKNTIRIYACGGAGLNLASSPSASNEDLPCFANVDTCFIDTSRANISESLKVRIPEEKLYIFKDANGVELDGSGKIRLTNADVITKNTLAVLQKFTPMQMNVVIHSTGGGSQTLTC